MEGWNKGSQSAHRPETAAEEAARKRAQVEELRRMDFDHSSSERGRRTAAEIKSLKKDIERLSKDS